MHVAPVAGRKGEVHTGTWWGDLREREYLEDLGICSRILKWTLGTWTGLIWLMVGRGGEKNGMCGACSTCGGKGKGRCILGFGGET